MRLNVEKALQVCGNNHKYQKIVFLVVVGIWFSVDFVSISFPLLEIQPKFMCMDKGLPYYSCKDEEACKMPGQFEVEKIYGNIVADFDLYCNKLSVMMVGIAYTIGNCLGAFIASKVSDYLGRKFFLIVLSFLFSCSSLASTFAPNVYFLFGLLFLIGLSSAGSVMISFMYVSEILSPQKRSIYGTLINSSFSIAGLIYFACFQFINNWRIISYIAVTVNILSGITILIFMVESPRYLNSMGKYKKCLASLNKISFKNGKEKEFYRFLLDSNIITYEKNDIYDYSTNNDSSNENDYRLQSRGKLNLKIKKMIKECKIESDDFNPKSVEPLLGKVEGSSNALPITPTASKKVEMGSFKSLFKFSSLRSNFLICCFIWMATCYSYYGLSLGLKNFYGDVFTNGYVVYCAEGISYMITGIIISIPFFGRKKTLLLMACITCISFLLYYFFEDYQPYNTILIFFARFGVTSMYSIMYILSTEIYPTIVRAKGLGLNTLCARIGSIMVPVLAEIIKPSNLNMIVFSSVCFISMLLSVFLPETFNKELEDEIQEEKTKVTQKIID
jgi:MFS family permease